MLLACKHHIGLVMEKCLIHVLFYRLFIFTFNLMKTHLVSSAILCTVKQKYCILKRKRGVPIVMCNNVGQADKNKVKIATILKSEG